MSSNMMGIYELRIVELSNLRIKNLEAQNLIKELRMVILEQESNLRIYESGVVCFGVLMRGFIYSLV